MRGETGTRSGGRRGAIDVVASERDRDRAFRRARRHTYLVRFLRLVLPMAAVACLGLYGAALVVSSRLKSRDIAVGKVTVDPTNLTMADPRYSGFAKDGAEYKVHAKSAVTDLRMSGPVRLDVIDGEITQPTGVVTRITAKWGTYDQKKDLLELYEAIDIDATNGMKPKLTRATVHAKESRVESPEPVWAETETGIIRANAMALDTKARKAAFRDAVEVSLRPRTPAAALKPAEAAPPKRDAQAFGLDANSGEPVVVTSRALDVDDTAKTALFRDAVVARQGEAVLAAPELDVIYEGQASLGGGAPAQAKPAGSGGGEQTKLKTIRARGGVTMTSKGDRAESQTLDYDAEGERVALAGNVVMTQLPERRITAETALLDQKADTALLTGDVVVTQGRNVLRGGRLAIDRKSGTAKLATPAVAGRGAGRVSTLFYQAQAQKAGSAPAKAAAATPDEQPLGPLGAGFKSDPNAPIEVEAATLDVNDRKHTAIYAGAVVAKQGAFVVRTEELTAHYAGDTGLLSGVPAQPQRDKVPAAGPGGSELRRIEARRSVLVTGTDGQQATGEWANFDVKANTVVMGGNVVVSQGKQVVRAPDGMRLLIDLGSGVTRFESEPGTAAAKSGPQVSGAFATSVAPSATGSAGNPVGCPPGAVCKSGRLEAIFYPNQIKEKAKQKAGAAGAAAGDAAAAAAETARGLVKRPTGGSSWSATGSAPPKP